MMRPRSLLAVAAVLSAMAGTTTLAAQAGAPLSAGQVAPDFVLPGASSAGPLQQPVRLSDLRGRTVVLAFFYKARTKG